MSGPGLRAGTLVLAGLLVAGLAGCREDPAPASQPAPPGGVQLTAAVPEHLSIGIVISLASAPGEGAEWRDAAEGARVATRRFELGHAAVALVAANDKGTARGAAAAVSTLVGRGVAGIVIATSGTHVQAGLDQAAKDGVPVLLPYADDLVDLPANAWLTGPTERTVATRLVAAVRKRGVTRPFLVDAGGGAIAGLAPSGRLPFRAGDDPATLGKALQRRRQRKRTAFDGVVVSGPAELQATVVQGLQGAGIDLPVFLTAQALSPTFPAALGKADGSLSGEFVTAGLDDGDAAALESSAAGRALAAYFSGLRLTAADPTTKDFFGERAFGAVAAVADVRSHDAVVALVRAAAAAGSTDPAKVAPALSGLRLDAGQGLAGPALDFSSPLAVADDAVVALGATPSSPGVRPKAEASSPALFWFPMPTS